MKTLMYAALLACCISTTWAANPTPESVKRYMQVTQTEAMLEQMLKQPIDFKTVVAQFEPDPAKQAAFLADTDQFLKQFDQHLDRAALLRGVEQAIADTFTQAEVDASIRFYETPEGQSILQKTPLFTQKMLGSIMPAMNQAMIQTLKDLSQKGK